MNILDAEEYGPRSGLGSLQIDLGIDLSATDALNEARRPAQPDLDRARKITHDLQLVGDVAKLDGDLNGRLGALLGRDREPEGERQQDAHQAQGEIVDAQ